MIIASALGHLGDRADADQERIEVEKHLPRLSIAQMQRDYVVFDAICLKRLLESLRRAGVRTSEPPY